MCGILGQFSSKQINFDKHILSRQLSLLDHRGPDKQETLFLENENLFFGHTRLAIIDLTDAGKQPMQSNSGRFLITFNGEIYNFLEIKHELLKINNNLKFNGDSDTEILLACIDQYGINRSLELIRGQFAFAAYDRKEKKLYLCRDRAGEKPLYYGFFNNSIFFASEIKCFSHLRPLKVNKDALNLFIAQGNVPAPFSIFENIYKLIPGHYLEYCNNENYKLTKYWDIEIDPNIAHQSFEDNYKIFEESFLQALKEQMVADVPLGAFLSGGLDSSAVVAGMLQLSSSKIKTHTISYGASAYDEGTIANSVANHLGTEHYDYHFRADEALNLIPDLPKIFCEPFSDSSQIPTFFLAKRTKSNVTVSLSGDGGDELFGGYNRYIFFARFQNIIGSISPNLRIKLSRIILKLLNLGISKKVILAVFNLFISSRGPLEKLEKILLSIQENDALDFYFCLLQQFHYQAWPLSKDISTDPRILYDSFLSKNVEDFTDMRFMDFKNYLPNDILTKLDRASMAVSLESRVPLLDRRLIDFAFSLPKNQLLSGDKGKLMLREFLKGKVPSEILMLPKSGFGVPIENWLRNELKEFAYETLFSNNDFEGIFDKQVLSNVWNDHLNNKSLQHHKIWTILMLKLWFKEYKSIATF